MIKRQMIYIYKDNEVILKEGQKRKQEKERLLILTKNIKIQLF